MGLQCVVNVPGPMSINVGNFTTLNAQSLSNFMGLTIASPSFFNFVLKKILSKSFGKCFAEQNRIMANRVVLINSIWGLDKPALLPPNHILTGPVFKTDRQKALQDLSIKDPYLFKWMNDAHERNIKIVYISLGSMCIW